LDQLHDNKYKTFNLIDREFTFTVDDKDIDCGLNGVLYLLAWMQMVVLIVRAVQVPILALVTVMLNALMI